MIFNNMKETIRCCISCILPCGAFDVIRIVHADGRVEEISHTVRAGDITRAYPKHVLRKPPSPASIEDDSRGSTARRAVVLSPSAELQRGKIYFLMPISEKGATRRKAEMAATERVSMLGQMKDRRRGRVGVWRPRLDSISEMMISRDL